MTAPRAATSPWTSPRDELPELAEIDVCVSNAAITDTIAPAHRMTAEQWARDIEVNLTGAFRAVQACLPGMRERGWGRIVVDFLGRRRRRACAGRSPTRPPRRACLGW